MSITASSSRLSERARRLKPSSTLAVTSRVKALKAEGRDIIGFGAGEPDFDTPQSIKQAAIDALLGGQTGYQPVPGTPDARRVIAEKLQRENGIDCDAGHIVVNVGAKHSIYLALMAIVDPGRDQQVVLPTPGWVSYRAMIELCGAEAVEVPGAVEADFKMTPAQLEAAITPRTVAVIINSPSNPCGTMYAPAELRALAAVIERHEQIVVVSDEIYEKLIYGSTEHLSLGSLDALADRVITINGLSKAFAMTGWRLGYLHGPGEFAGAIARLQGQMTSHPCSFAFPAIVEAITNGAAAVESMRETFAERAEYMYGRLSAMPGIVCPRPTGAFYAFPSVGAHFGRTSPEGRKIESSLAFAEALLEEAHVAVVPGDDFGECARTHVRMSFACSREDIEEGCNRLESWIDRLR